VFEGLDDRGKPQDWHISRWSDEGSGDWQKTWNGLERHSSPNSPHSAGRCTG